jgi:hypothetical protein
MVEQARQVRKEVGSKLLYFVTQNPVIIKFFSKRQLPFPHSILNLVRIRDIDKQLRAMPVERAWFWRLGFQVARLVNNIQNAFRGSMLVNQCLHIKGTTVFDTRIDHFWREVVDHHGFIVERSSDYLNWRYCDQRAGDFFVKLVEDDGHILGYSVLRVNRYFEEYPVGYIVDLLALPNRLDAVEALVMDAVNYFDEQNINIVNSLVVKNHPYVEILNRYGFLDSRIKLQLFISSASELLEEVNALKSLTPEKIHFSYGELDSLPLQIPETR